MNFFEEKFAVNDATSTEEVLAKLIEMHDFIDGLQERRRNFIREHALVPTPIWLFTNIQLWVMKRNARKLLDNEHTSDPLLYLQRSVLVLSSLCESRYRNDINLINEINLETDGFLEVQQPDRSVAASQMAGYQEDMIETKMFDASDLSLHPSCSICLAHFENNDQMKWLPCEHNFHPDCINRWFQQSSKCPFCRFDLRDYIIKKVCERTPGWCPTTTAAAAADSQASPNNVNINDENIV